MDNRSLTIVCRNMVPQSKCQMAKGHKEAMFGVIFVPLLDCILLVVDPQDEGTLRGAFLYLSTWRWLSTLLS